MTAEDLIDFIVLGVSPKPVFGHPCHQILSIALDGAVWRKCVSNYRMPRHRKSFWRSTLHMSTPHYLFSTNKASWRSYATGASYISRSLLWCASRPHLVLGTLLMGAATDLTHLPRCNLGVVARTYPHCSCSQCSPLRPDIRRLMITTDHHQKAPCGPLAMHILQRRNDFWILLMLPLAQPHVRHCS